MKRSSWGKRSVAAALLGSGVVIMTSAAVEASVAPVPPAERGLAAQTADLWFEVSADSMTLEGPVFDRQGDLLFVDVFGGQILKVSPDRRLTRLFGPSELRPVGLALHQDGRIFVATVGDFRSGAIVALNPDGTGLTEIVSASAGFLPDEIVFDARGGFYFSDLKGGPGRPEGGVYYAPAEGSAPAAVLTGLAAANGLGLSPDGKTLWVTEYAAGRVIRVRLQGPGLLAPFGAMFVYHLTGASADSLRVDGAGNVYVAVNEQGRILVLNPLGLPVGQILLPGRDRGRNLSVTSLALKPGTREIYIVASNGAGGGASIFRARALAPALPTSVDPQGEDRKVAGDQ